MFPATESEAAPRPAGALDALPIEPRTEPRAADAPARPLRLHEEHDPAPRHSRLFALSGWSAGMVLVGFLIAVRLAAAMFLEQGPGWLAPTMIGIAVGGIVAAGVAFASIHRSRWPYLAMSVSTALLAINLLLVLAYLT
jgi:hypothetical protein